MFKIDHKDLLALSKSNVQINGRNDVGNGLGIITEEYESGAHDWTYKYNLFFPIVFPILTKLCIEIIKFLDNHIIK